MRLVRVALASVNTTVGACRSNVDRAIAAARAAADDGATVVAFPEQLVGGYPPEDLVQWRAFVDAQAHELRRFARETASLGCASALGLVVARGSHLYNVAALVHGGRVWGLVPKEKLPLYNVFYEARTLAGCPASTTSSRACRSAIWSSSWTSVRSRSRSARTDGRPTGPCAGAPTRAPSW